jgi:hypothetical protein
MQIQLNQVVWIIEFGLKDILFEILIIAQVGAFNERPVYSIRYVPIIEGQIEYFGAYLNPFS